MKLSDYEAADYTDPIPILHLYSTYLPTKSAESFIVDFCTIFTKIKEIHTGAEFSSIQTYNRVLFQYMRELGSSD
jgi:hypothetical protein